LIVIFLEAKREDVEDIATFYHILGKLKSQKGVST
jgi:hypothetical protein